MFVELREHAQEKQMFQDTSRQSVIAAHKGQRKCYHIEFTLLGISYQLYVFKLWFESL